MNNVEFKKEKERESKKGAGQTLSLQRFGQYGILSLQRFGQCGILFLLIMLSCAVRLAAIGINYTPRELIVKTAEPLITRGVNFDVPEIDSFLAELAVKEIKPVTPSAENRFYVVRTENDFTWERIRRRYEGSDMRRSGIVEYIQPNYLNEMFVRPNDPLFSQQYLEIMRIPQAWRHETGSEQIIVALIDSGLWFDHPEFICQSNIWINEAEYPPNGEDSSGNGYIDDWRGWNFVDAPELADIALGKFIGQDNEPFDESGHGTHVAGIIGAKTNNGIGISGVCWNVKMMILRAGFRTTTGTGYLQDDDAAAAIIYAADNGANVINISWGSSSFSQIIADACQYAYNRGSIIVASAGNTPQPVLMYPAKLNTTISVGAVDNNLNLTGFSSYGPDLDLVAPGQNILSTYIEQDDEVYRRLSGTSMSAPYVTAAIALLLSKEPSLSFNEVTARLFNSTIDLGEEGFDNRYGHGLIDVEKLLKSDYTPYINVTYPLNNQGQPGTFDIIGSIIHPHLFRYSVMFTDAIEPTEVDWKDVDVDHPRYYSEVRDGVIATFNVPYTLPDKEYLVRIRMETIYQGRSRTYQNRFRVSINKAKPSLKGDLLTVTKRYQGAIPAYFLQAGFDQEVFLQVDLIAGGKGRRTEDGEQIVRTIHSNYADSLHILQIPADFGEEKLDFRLRAINNSGLKYESDLITGMISIDKQAIPTHSFNSEIAGPALISIGKTYDFSGNSLPEFVGMELEEGIITGKISAFELADTGRMVRKHTFEDNFLPLDMGNTNGEGQEIFGLVLDSGFIIETWGDSNYPNVNLWSKNDVVGGNFGDCNNDGRDELLLIRNVANERVVSVFQRTGNTSYGEINTLRNDTETDTRNNFVPRVAVGDLNNNGYANVLTADTDGDVMLFEIYGPEQDSLIFHHRLPVPNAYHLSIADFTGDGNLEFCVGGYSYLYTDPNKIFWYFQFYGFNETTRSFETTGYISFDHFESINSIKAMDINGNGRSELILALTPYLYIAGFDGESYKPIWIGESHSTYQIIPIKENFNTPAGVIVNSLLDETLYSHFVTLSGETGPPAPAGLTGKPLGESSIELTWNDSGAEHYYIYRQDGQMPIDTVYVNSYKDTGLEQGVEYRYSVRAYNPAYTPSISLPTPWVAVTPYSVPEIRDIRMTGRYEVRVLFDVQLSNDAINVGYYTLNNGIGVPASVNHTHNHRGLHLRFFEPLIQPVEPYILRIDGLKGRSGVSFPAGEYGFEYISDIEPPYPVRYQIAGNNSIDVFFNKVLNKNIAEDISNYHLVTPVVDPFNEIVAVVYTDSVLTFTFTGDLKISNQSYSLKMNNIEDLFGNVIPNNKNILEFRITDIDNLDHVMVIPNPLIRNRKGHNAVRFIGLPLEKEGDIYIYSLAGELIYKKRIGPLSERQSELTIWDEVNHRGKVSSGTYFYIIEMGGDVARGRFVVIN